VAAAAAAGGVHHHHHHHPLDGWLATNDGSGERAGESEAIKAAAWKLALGAKGKQW